MITLHRLGHAAEPFHLNPDLIVTVEANPDTVVTLTTGTKIVVAEPPERVVDEIRDLPGRASSRGRCSSAGGKRARRSRTRSTRAGPRRACSWRSTAAPGQMAAASRNPTRTSAGPRSTTDERYSSGSWPAATTRSRVYARAHPAEPRTSM